MKQIDAVHAELLSTLEQILVEAEQVRLQMPAIYSEAAKNADQINQTLKAAFEEHRTQTLQVVAFVKSKHQEMLTEAEKTEKRMARQTQASLQQFRSLLVGNAVATAVTLLMVIGMVFR